nr:hypothetical protein [Pandoravirus massiliensis]
MRPTATLRRHFAVPPGFTLFFSRYISPDLATGLGDGTRRRPTQRAPMVSVFMGKIVFFPYFFHEGKNRKAARCCASSLFFVNHVRPLSLVVSLSAPRKTLLLPKENRQPRARDRKKYGERATIFFFTSVALRPLCSAFAAPLLWQSKTTRTTRTWKKSRGQAQKSLKTSEGNHTHTQTQKMNVFCFYWARRRIFFQHCIWRFMLNSDGILVAA